MEEKQEFEGWAIVEIMGHNEYAGYVSSQSMAGGALVRVDIPKTDNAQPWSKMFGVASIYGMTPCSEEVARLRANQIKASPINEYEFEPEVRRAIREFRGDANRPLLTDDSDEGGWE